jgi:hypothetical protein
VGHVADEAGMFSTGKTCQVYGKTAFILRLRKGFLGVDRRWPWRKGGLWGLKNFFEKSVLRSRIGDFGVEFGVGVRRGGVGLVGRVAPDESPFQKTRMSPFFRALFTSQHCSIDEQRIDLILPCRTKSRIENLYVCRCVA